MAEHVEDGVIVEGPVLFPHRPYRAAEGFVFVAIDVEEEGRTWFARERASAEAAGDEIITCVRCQQPAVQIDHCWPYEEATTLCAEHVEAFREEQRQANRELRERLRRLPAVEQELAEAKEWIAELQAKVDAIRARRCETCTHWTRSGDLDTGICGFWASGSRRYAYDDELCRHWQAKVAGDA